MSRATQTKVKFLPVREAADLVSYTPDYVAKLARQDKIKAHQEGRQWMVDVDSLKLFELQGEADRKRRAEQLRNERLRELASVQQTAVEQNVISHTQATTAPALLLTAVTVACSLVVGVLIHTISIEKISFRTMAASLATVVLQVGDVLPFPAYEKFFAVEDTPGSSSSAASCEDCAEVVDPQLQALFSDPVRVIETTEELQIIQPVFSEESDFSYSVQPIDVTRIENQYE